MSPRTDTIVYCSGPTHRKSGVLRQVDLRATHGPMAPGLVEDGNVFCTNCAGDLARVCVDNREYTHAY